MKKIDTTTPRRRHDPRIAAHGASPAARVHIAAPPA